MVPTPEYLFVYGTLMQEFDNPFAEKLRKLSVLEGNGSFPGLLYLVDWYPGAVFSKNQLSRVYGEIYKMSNSSDLMRELDEYEDISEDENISLYLRRIVPVTFEDDTVLDCWTYLYNQPVVDLSRIESGNFRNFRSI